jgi:hypothetical protein
MDADGWTDQYKSADSTRANALLAAPAATTSDPQQHVPASRSRGRTGVRLLVAVCLIGVVGTGAAFATAAMKPAEPQSPYSASPFIDEHGFALGGPPAPTIVAKKDNPSHSECVKLRNQMHAWSDYQNAYRPADSTDRLPSKGVVRYLSTECGLKF